MRPSFQRGGDRTSSTKWWTNQYRVLIAALAYIALETMRRTALRGTHLARAQCQTLRLRLLKIGAVVTRNTRRIVLRLSSSYPDQAVFRGSAAAHRRIIATARTQCQTTDPGNAPERRPTLPHLQAVRTAPRRPNRSTQNAAVGHSGSIYRPKLPAIDPNTTQKTKTEPFAQRAG